MEYAMPKYLSHAERFWSKVKFAKNEECWEWKGSKNNTGYGLLTKTGRGKVNESLAHRLAWALSFGEIPNGLEVGHKCSNRSCVNLSHLYLTTRLENLREMRNRDNYDYIDSIDIPIIAQAMKHARAIHALWEIRNADLDNLSPEKILELRRVFYDEALDSGDSITDYQKPDVEIMPCGHHPRYVVHADEGTAWCLMCEYLATSDTLQKIKKIFKLE